MGIFQTQLLIGLLAAIAIALPSEQLQAADPIPIEIHEWSLWIVDPTHGQTNSKEQYPNTLPVFVDSTRSRLTGRAEGRPSPLGMITFYGEPTTPVETELQLGSLSRLLAHWPPAETKSKRARWLDLALSVEPDADARIAPAEPGHWFEKVRALEGALFLKLGTRSERCLCYDVETGWSPGVKLSGGPDKYDVENLDKGPIEDLFICVPLGDTRRVGRLSLLPAKPKKAEDAKKADEQKPNGEKPADKQGTASAAPNAVNPDAQDKPAEVKPAEKEPTVEVTMSAALGPDSEEYIAQTRTALRQVMIDAGLKPDEADLFLSLYADQIFKSKETIVLFRLPSGAIDEQLPLVTYPDAKRIVRVPLVLMRNVDPKMQTGLKDLVALLGDADYHARQKAEKQLKDSGRLAVPILKEALKNDDPEIVFRAERLLLAQNENIDEGSAILPKPQEEKKDDKKNADRKDGAKQGTDKKEAAKDGENKKAETKDADEDDKKEDDKNKANDTTASK